LPKKVQECATESWENDEKQREVIMNNLTEVKETLEQLQLTTMQWKEQVPQKHSAQKKIVPAQEMVQIIASGNENFLSLRTCYRWMRR
jgi:hypothetical protein